MGYIHDVDLASLSALKRQLEGSSAPEPQKVEIKETPLRELSFEPFDVENFKRMGDYVRCQDVNEGKGEFPLKGHKIHISYVIHTTDGKTIDSEDAEMKKQLPWARKVAFAVGKLCPGLDLAIQTMREGGRRQIVIRPEYAFGEKGFAKAGISGGKSIMVDLTLRKC